MIVDTRLQKCQCSIFTNKNHNKIKMNYEMISKMNVDELKSYLKLRCLRVGGKKEELVARVFVAVENNVQPVKTAVEVEKDLKLCYEKKLNVDGRNIPDPMKIPHGWMEEDEGTFLANVNLSIYIYILDVFSC